jgi:hypothetical protein
MVARAQPVAFAIATPVAWSVVNARCEADAHVLAGCLYKL